MGRKNLAAQRSAIRQRDFQPIVRPQIIKSNRAGILLTIQSLRPDFSDGLGIGAVRLLALKEGCRLDGNKLLRVFGDELKFHVRLDAYIGAGREHWNKDKCNYPE